jgi:hypothetical protein
MEEREEREGERRRFRSAVTGQGRGEEEFLFSGCWAGIEKKRPRRTPSAKLRGTSAIRRKLVVRATDAKEVGVENPAEETFCHSNQTKFVR